MPLHLVLTYVLVSGFLKSWSAREHQLQQIIVLARSAQQRSETGESVYGGIHFMWAFSHHAASSCDSYQDQPAVLRQPLLEIHNFSYHHYLSLFLLFFSLSLSLAFL